MEHSLLPLADMLEADKNNQELSGFRKIFRYDFFLLTRSD